MIETARDFIARRLGEDLIGPLDSDEVLDSYPTDVYLTGILYPQDSPVCSESDDSDLIERAKDDAGTERDGVPLNLQMRSPSFGFSFAVCDSEAKPKVKVLFRGARYELVEASESFDRGGCSNQHVPDAEDAKSAEEEAFVLPSDEELDEVDIQLWARQTLETEIQLPIADIDGVVDFRSDSHGLEGFDYTSECYLGSGLCTVTAVNENAVLQDDTRKDREEKTFFQTHLSVEAATGSTFFIPRAIKWSAQDSDSGLAQLLYRKNARIRGWPRLLSCLVCAG